MAFDAGTIVAHLDLDDQDFDRKLRADVARIEAFEKRSHDIRLTPQVDQQDASQARRAMALVDRQITNDARSRGGVLGVLHGLFGRGGRLVPGGGGGGASTLARLFSSAGGGGGGVASGLISGAGPGFGPIGAQPALIGAAIPVVGAALPALAGVGATAGVGAVGAGVLALGASQLIGSKNVRGQPATQGVLYNPAKQLMDQMKDTITQGAQPLVAPLRRAFAELGGPGGILANLVRPLRTLFAGAATLITPLVHGITDLAYMILPGLGAAFRAVAPSIQPLLDGVGLLVKNIFPGLNALLRATAPTMGIFVRALANVGRDLGQMFAVMAPAVRPSMIVLKALLDVVGGLLPVIGKLAAIFATALAPVVVAFGRAIQILEPTLLIVGEVLAKLAGAVLADLAAVLITVARLIAGIAPSLRILGAVLGQVFATMESAGVFGALAVALEKLAPLFAQLINLIVAQLMPILPALITLFVQITQIMIMGFAAGLGAILRGVTSLLQHMPFLVPLIASIIVVWAAWNLVMSLSPFGLIIIGTSLLIGAILLLSTHWHRVWTDISNWARDAWEFLTHGWGQWLIPGLTVIRLGVAFLRDHWRGAWNDMKNIALSAWHFLHDDVFAPLINFVEHSVPHAWDVGVQGVKKAWQVLGDVTKGPVNWVIGNVINGLIRAFDWVASRVHAPQIPVVPLIGHQSGGRIPGYGGGDRHLSLLEGGEAVVSKETTSMHAADLAAWGVPGFQAGGRVGQSPIGARVGGPADPARFHGGPGIFGSIARRTADIGKIVLALATGNTQAATNAFVDLFPHGVGGAGADLAKLLVETPARLVTDVIHDLMGFGGSGLGGRGPEIARWAMQWLGKIPYVWGGTAVPGGADCSGFVQAVYRHFGISAPRTSEAQGSWVARGTPQIGGLAFYNSPAGGPPPGHVAIVGFGGNVISQGGGMGPQYQALRSMPLMFTGVPPGSGRGGVTGGTMNGAQIANLWKALGGPVYAAHDMARIAFAESGDHPSIIQQGQPPGLTGYGLYQITPTSGIWQNGAFGNLLNASNNTRAAISLFRKMGYHAWATAPALGLDSGGWLDPGVALTLNATRRREAVLNPSQSRAFIALSEAAESFARGRGTPGGSLMRDVYLTLPEGTTVAQALAEVGFRLRMEAQQGYTGVAHA